MTRWAWQRGWKLGLDAYWVSSLSLGVIALTQMS